MTALLGIADGIRNWSIPDILVVVVIIAICIGIAVIVVKKSGVPIPDWFWQIVGLILLGVLAVFAIRFVSSL